MTAAAHALIGASIAAKITNPYLGIPIAIFSHFIADLIPHWDAGTNHRKKTKARLRKEAAFDVILGFLLSFLIFRNIVDTNYLIVMILAAQLPDWLEAPVWMFNLRYPPFSWVHWLSHNLQSRMQLPWGLVTQIITIGILLIVSGGAIEVSNSLASIFPFSLN